MTDAEIFDPGLIDRLKAQYPETDIGALKREIALRHSQGKVTKPSGALVAAARNASAEGRYRLDRPFTPPPSEPARIPDLAAAPQPAVEAAVLETQPQHPQDGREARRRARQDVALGFENIARAMLELAKSLRTMD